MASRRKASGIRGRGYPAGIDSAHGRVTARRLHGRALRALPGGHRPAGTLPSPPARAAPGLEADALARGRGRAGGRRHRPDARGPERAPAPARGPGAVGRGPRAARRRRPARGPAPARRLPGRARGRPGRRGPPPDGGGARAQAAQARPRAPRVLDGRLRGRPGAGGRIAAVARVLIVGCGCRGLELARSLRAGGQAWVGDPDRVGSLVYAMDNVTTVCWLLGRVGGAALHGPRLRMMLEKTVDTTVRGFAYEPAAEPALRASGLALLAEAAATWEIPTAIVEGD